MTHASLFSGIGGFELAARWAGLINTFWCEIDPFCQTVLKYHFPNSIGYGNIKSTNFTQWRGQIDILSGGFPCQPFSIAGKRKGTEDNRYLWSEFKRVISEIRPTWVIGENVGGIISMVQPGDEIKVEYQTSFFEEDYTQTILEEEFIVETICRDFESIGYSVQTFVIPACAVGAPHRRDRIWFIAHNTDTRDEKVRQRQDGILSDQLVANATSSRWIQKHQGEQSKNIAQNIPNWENFPTQPPICCRDDGFPSRLDSITIPKWRSESLKAYGNAIVPQVALELFNAIIMNNKFK